MEQREDRFTIKAFDCQPDARIKPNALMQYLQEAAARHAEQLGAGLADLNEQNCYWVLANLRLEFTRRPKWNDGLTIRTWPSGLTRLVASREFVGIDQKGQECFRAGSEWMVLDQKSGRPRNLSRLDFDLPQTGPKALTTGLRRLQPAEGHVRAGNLRVPFSALDFNGHVNNTEYLRWAIDALHDQFGLASRIRSLEVTYLAELFEGDNIDVLVSRPNDTSFSVVVHRLDEPADAFVMEVTC